MWIFACSVILNVSSVQNRTSIMRESAGTVKTRAKALAIDCAIMYNPEVVNSAARAGGFSVFRGVREMKMQNGSGVFRRPSTVRGQRMERILRSSSFYWENMPILPSFWHYDKLTLWKNRFILIMARHELYLFMEDNTQW